MSKDDSPLVAVVVCTHNRARHLAGCLGSLAAQDVPAGTAEFIVVDDGSTDATADVCAQAAQGNAWRIIRQPNAGLGAARQRGWQATRAPVVAFLDDDAIAPPDWLRRVIRRMETGSKAPEVLGGPTRARWEAPRPAWLDDSLLPWLTVWSPFPDYQESTRDPLFVGANMVFLRRALEAVGGFSPALGRRGSSLLSHEESELWRRLQQLGAKSAYDPELWVEHCVPAERLRRAWFRRRIFWEGVSMVRRERTAGDRWRPRAAASAVWQALAGAGLFTHLRHPRRWGRSLGWQLHVAYKLGCAREWLRRHPLGSP